MSFAGKYPRTSWVGLPPHGCRPGTWSAARTRSSPSELTGDEPNDGYPVLLPDWIERDGLKCLKVKLRGNDAAWDYDRLVRVGQIAIEHGVEWLSTDFNCTVTDPAYVNAISGPA